MSNVEIRGMFVQVMEEKPNGVPVYGARRNGNCWKDDYPSGALDAAFYDEDKYDMAEEVDSLSSNPLEEYEVEVLDDGGVWRARMVSDTGVDGEMGDGPGEAVDSLIRNYDVADHTPITTETTLKSQLKEILKSRITDFYSTTRAYWLVNEDALGRQVQPPEVAGALDELADDSDTVVEQTEHDRFNNTDMFPK